MRKIVIVGAGGFGREAAWLIERINNICATFELAGFCDSAPGLQSGRLGRYHLLGDLRPELLDLGINGFFCAIGENSARARVMAAGESLGLIPVTLIDPSATIAPDAVIGAGSYIGIHSTLSVGVKAGRGVLINHHVCVGHDVTIGDWAQLCPGVCVSGGCTIGRGALLGTLAGTIPLKHIGAGATLGAGTLALRDLQEDATRVRLR